MAISPIGRLAKELADAGLRQAAHDPRAVVRGYRLDGVHHWFDHHKAGGFESYEATRRTVSLDALLEEDPPLCASCNRVAEFTLMPGRDATKFIIDLNYLLRIHRELTGVDRKLRRIERLARPESALGAAEKALSWSQDLLESIDEPDLAAPRRGVVEFRDRVAATVRALSQSGVTLDRLLERVRQELIPADKEVFFDLDDRTVIIGIDCGTPLTALAQEVVTTCALVSPPRRGKAILRAPLYVRDYLLMNVARRFHEIQLLPDGSELTPQEAELVLALWDSAENSAMCNLSTAVEMVRCARTEPTDA